MTYQAGFARRDISVYEPDTAMLGYGMPYNRVDGIAEPIYARAMVLRQGADVLVYLCTEQCFPAPALRTQVIEKLLSDHPDRGFSQHTVCWTATHNHAAPNGYCHYTTHHGMNFGFSPLIFETLRDRFVDAIVAADDAREPAILSVGVTEIDASEPVAFNRSLASWKRNPEAATSAPVSRTSVTLRVDDSQGRGLGLINWFAVHGTSIHSDNTKIHSDNKGLASVEVERVASERGYHPDFVAIFAQEAAGDITPNDRWSWRRWRIVGRGKDDHESALINARIQAKAALAASDKATVIEGPIVAAMRRVDFGHRPVPARFAQGFDGMTTSAGTLGSTMAGGTAEGPGPLRPFVPAFRMISGARHLAHRVRGRPGDNKVPLLEVGGGAAGLVVGRIPLRKAFATVAKIEPMIAWAKAADDAGFMDDTPWTPRVLPIQLVQIGPLLIVAIPVEPTTVAGARIRKVLEAATAGQGVERIIINGYANAYGGYVTTPEEYSAQRYEAGYTLFGPWTLGAYCSELEKLANRFQTLDAQAPVEGPAEDRFDMEFLIEQRIAGRRAVAKHRGTELAVPRLANDGPGA